MRFCLTAVILTVVFSCSNEIDNYTVTTGTLIEEMTDLNRLTKLSLQGYRTIQFSSYDRRSTKPTDSCWFSNEDGFGNEPIPGFEAVLVKPDTNGIGEYLICDVKGPGAILRLWTAGINGKLKLFLDKTDAPVYEGSAQDFFWKTIEQFSGNGPDNDYSGTFRQFDATYFPIPFSARCRIEWTGDISKIHFYHVGVRLYGPDVKVQTFKISDVEKYRSALKDVAALLSNPGLDSGNTDKKIISSETKIGPGERKVLFKEAGSKAITGFSVKLQTSDIEQALRKNILSIWFDDSSIPQVEAPLGDFFGSAPGLNPYISLPFSVTEDSTLICRFIMPFRSNVRIEVENRSGTGLHIYPKVMTGEYRWDNQSSMHFRTHWTIDHGMTASYFDQGNHNISDILYLMASGKGRVVGAAAYIYNPSNATTSWGNWWGEGDEKIFVDQDTFPSFFGTGSEDYFNYSWSSSRIFSYPYCGQPRNDGPGNRGYVSNYRWHITDDIRFNDKIAFFMELGHHGIVNDFSYGRIVYFYAFPGTIDNYRKISENDIKEIPYLNWKPIAYLGSEGYTYIQAEYVVKHNPDVVIENCKISADEKILIWSPVKRSEKLRFELSGVKKLEKTNLGFTMSHSPGGGVVSVSLNGSPVKMDGKTEINLFEPHQTILVNHFSEKVNLRKGVNEVVIESKDTGKQSKVGIDFIWMKKD